MSMDVWDYACRCIYLRRATWWGRCEVVMDHAGDSAAVFRGSRRACDAFATALRNLLVAFCKESKERTETCQAIELAKVDAVPLHKPGLVVFRAEEQQVARQIMGALARLASAVPQDMAGTLFLVMPPDVAVESLSEEGMASAGWVRSV